ARGDAHAAGEALAWNERALARALLDRLSELAVNAPPVAGGSPEVEGLRQQWRVTMAQFLIAAETGNGQARAEALRQDITALDVQLRSAEARAEAGDTARARLVEPATLSPEALRALLDDDTTLLEYALGTTQSYLWVVTSREIHTFTLAPRAQIEMAARSVHHDLLNATDAPQPGAEARRLALARLVIAPAASKLSGRRLAIVATGALSLVPFAALPFEGPGAPPALLTSRFQIVHLPSATTLAAMRALTDGRVAPSREMVIFADPIFEALDPRTRRIPGTAAPRTPGPSNQAQPSNQQAGPGVSGPLARLGASFPRLPFSRGEATTLSDLTAKQATMWLDGQATRERALGETLGGYRFIHFATHAVVHSDLPNLSSIVLSFVDEAGATHDPFLTLSDIYQMRLAADVVVLSACSTAEGRQVPGEGPIGLARAFMYAGAARVVASLWPVNDFATAELMKRFYRGMLEEKLSPAAALWAAQQQIASIPRWRSPHYWAPFVLQGDWR
ncbi:MAG: CHAT domain-containing protein, partial [Vicinamibacterales bacterium]